MIVFHHNDADGRCAAAIVKKWFDERSSVEGDARGKIVFREMDYKDDPCFDDVMDEEVAIVDFSFEPDVMSRLMEKTSRIIWCDHHKTAAEYDYGAELAGERDFTEKGRAGCECTWDFFFPNNLPSGGVVMLGDYDAWRLRFGPRTFAYYEGLKLADTRPDAPLWARILNGDEGFIDRIVMQGETAIQYRNNYCREIMQAFGYETEIDGVAAYATNLYRFGSQGFVDNWGKYPVCIAYIYDGRKFTVSLYSENVDVGEIAKRHGGGGHKGAAGFVCTELPFQRRVP